jgi:hypothetical protein
VHAPIEGTDDVKKDSFYRELEQVLVHFPTYHIKILLGDFNAKVGTEEGREGGHFKSVIGNESLHEASNDNGVRALNFETSKNLSVKSTTFPHGDIHKHTWNSRDCVIHSETDYILIDKRRHSDILDVRSLRVVSCDTDYYLVITELRERIAVS